MLAEYIPPILVLVAAFIIAAFIIWVGRKTPNSQEEYWNNKYPKATVIYQGRQIPNHGAVAVDVRTFFTNPVSDELLATVKDFGGSDDARALACLKWVIANITYQSDFSLFGLNEFWEFPFETMLTRRGDCDDGAILLANLMLKSGIPYWKIRLTAGMVPEGGHAYVTYFCEARGLWVALDWCYYPSEEPVADRPDYKFSEIYREVWFSWNRDFSFCAGVKTGYDLSRGHVQTGEQK